VITFEGHEPAPAWPSSLSPAFIFSLFQAAWASIRSCS